MNITILWQDLLYSAGFIIYHAKKTWAMMQEHPQTKTLPTIHIRTAPYHTRVPKYTYPKMPMHENISMNTSTLPQRHLLITACAYVWINMSISSDCDTTSQTKQPPSEEEAAHAKHEDVQCYMWKRPAQVFGNAQAYRAPSQQDPKES